MCVCVCVCVSVCVCMRTHVRACVCTQPCLTLCNSMDCSLPVSSVHGIFPGKNSAESEYWSGLLFSSAGDLPNLDIKFRLPALQADSLPSESQRNPVSGKGCSKKEHRRGHAITHYMSHRSIYGSRRKV